MSRRIESVCGGLAAFLGLAGISIALFAETKMSSVPGNGITWMDRTAWWGHGVDTQLATYLGVMLAALLATALGTFLHARLRHGIGLGMIWIGVFVMSIGVALDLPNYASMVSASGVSAWNDIGIGIFLIPAELLGLVAGIAGSIVQIESGSALSAPST